jgi:arsenate reductase
VSGLEVLTIYGITSCDSCRKARKWLAQHSMEHEFHDLRADGLDIQMLERWSSRLDWTKLLNKKSLTWRKIPETDRNDMSKDKALASMIQHPTLVKRPVLECKEFIALGFSPENYQAIFTKMGLL